MAAGSGAILLLGLRGGGLQALAPGVLGVAFFGPAFVILLWAFVRPNYLAIDDEGVQFRMYCVEGRIPWEEIGQVSAGAGWPSLTFDDCERVSRQVRLCGVRPLGWVLEIPTRAVSLMIRRPLANIYPATAGQLARGFRANEEMFGFHYGLPTSLLEGTTEEMVRAVRKEWRARRDLNPRPTGSKPAALSS